MSEFQTFSRAVRARYETMAKQELFVVDALDIFESYLSFFPEGTNPIFRERTEHDCNCCKNFIRRLGNLVAFDTDGDRMTVWDSFVHLPEPYRTVGQKMAQLVRQAPVVSVFRSKEHQYGAEKTPDSHEHRIWHHFHGEVHRKHYSSTPDKTRGDINTTKDVFKRGLEELNSEAFETVIEWIESKTLYRGEEHLRSVKEFQKIQREYAQAIDKDAFLWSNVDNRAARFRNTVIGTLLTDLSNGVDPEAALRMFESKVAPANYKRPKAAITPKMVEQAVEKLKELGLEGAVHRRYARMSDVSINNVIWADRAAQTKMKDALTELLIPETTRQPVDLKHATEISMNEFLINVLPSATAMDLVVRNNQLNKFMSLTMGDGPERLFKWDNNFAWSYDGEVTDSIKERVKAAGGKVTGVKLRVSLAWFNGDDLDIHAYGPSAQHIFYGNKSGVLDVDMNAGYSSNSKDPVENLSWVTMPVGRWRISVNQYRKTTKNNPGFNLEVEHNGALHQFSYDREVTGNVHALELTIASNGNLEIRPCAGINGGSSSTDKWGVQTETLVPVQTLMASPNHWDGQNIGNKHWFFILQGCVNPEPTRGIYNEFLRSDLDQHRKVFEVLGSKTKCPSTPDQLSGVGFSSTLQDKVTVVVKEGTKSRAYNINF